MTIEQEFTDTLVEEYSRAGWQVEDPAIAAEQLDFRPDLVLKRGNETLVIEVIRAGFVSERAVSRIKRKVEEKPNWHFELKLIPPSREFKAERPVREDIKRTDCYRGASSRRGLRQRSLYFDLDRPRGNPSRPS
jgi:REase_AHJR-like